MNGKTIAAALFALAFGLSAGGLAAYTWITSTDQAAGTAPAAEDHSERGGSGAGLCVITPETAGTIGLRVHDVDFGPVEEVVDLLGTVEAAPDRRHVVAPRTAGQVLHVDVQIGDVVRQGDVLLDIDSPELARNKYEARRLETSYRELQVELTRTRGRVRELEVEHETVAEAAELAEAQVKRLESAEQVVALNELYDRRAAALSARALVRRKAVELQVAREEVKAVVEQAEALQLSRETLLAVSNIDPAQLVTPADLCDRAHCRDAAQRMSLIRLRAPIDGVVVERNVSRGESVTAGRPLLVVADYSKVQIHGELPESIVSRLSRRNPSQARIRPRSDPDRVIDGQVRFISPVIDSVKRTAHLIVDAQNPDGVLRDGAFVSLSVVVRDMIDPKEWPVVVPASAVLQDGPAYFVFKQAGLEELTFARQEITPGAGNDEFVEVREGLFPGDVVASQGVYNLSQIRTGDSEPVDPHAGHNH